MHTHIHARARARAHQRQKEREGGDTTAHWQKSDAKACSLDIKNEVRCVTIYFADVLGSWGGGGVQLLEMFQKRRRKRRRKQLNTQSVTDPVLGVP